MKKSSFNFLGFLLWVILGMLAVTATCKIAFGHDYKFRFNLNPEPDVHFYRCIIYDAATPEYVNPVDTVIFYHNTFTDSVYFEMPFPENGRFLSFQVVAIDSGGLESPPGFSNILERVNVPPVQPINAGVKY